MAFDDTELQLALAEDEQAFHAGMSAKWPSSLYDLVGSLVNHQDAKTAGSTSSSITIGPGSISFTLDTPQPQWAVGTPLYLMEDGSPSTNVIAGRITANTGGAITMDVQFYKGSGTYTLWAVLALFAVAFVVSPPVAIADGGTGADTAAGARAALGVMPAIDVQAVAEHEASLTPSAGDSYVVAVSPTGDFVGHDDKIATYNGTSWDYRTPEVGEVVYDKDAAALSTLGTKGAQYVYHGTTTFEGRRTQNGSKWGYVGGPAGNVHYILGSNGLTITDAELTSNHVSLVAGAAMSPPFSITLPQNSVPRIWYITNPPTTGGSATLTVTGGGVIQEQSSLVLAGDEGVTLLGFIGSYFIVGKH